MLLNLESVQIEILHVVSAFNNTSRTLQFCQLPCMHDTFRGFTLQQDQDPQPSSPAHKQPRNVAVNTSLEKAARENSALSALERELDAEERGNGNGGGRPTSQASSRGPLKTSSQQMRVTGGSQPTNAIMGVPQQHQMTNAAIGGVVDVRNHPPLPGQGSLGGQQNRGFLRTLQASMPREIAMLTGARRLTILDQKPALPGVAEETPSQLVTNPTDPAGEIAANAAVLQQAPAAQVHRPDSPTRRQQRLSSLYQYFVGRPHGASLVQRAEQTPQLQAPAQPLAGGVQGQALQAQAAPQQQQQQQAPVVQRRLSQAQAASLSPQFFTPNVPTNDTSELRGGSVLGGYQRVGMHSPIGSQPTSRAGALAHSQAPAQAAPQARRMSAYAPPNIMPSAPSGMPDAGPGLQTVVSGVQPRAPSWTQSALPPMPSFDQRQGSNAGQPGLGAPRNMAANAVLRNANSQRWQDMAKRSRSTLAAAQQATPAEAQAMLSRITSMQRQQAARTRRA